MTGRRSARTVLTAATLGKVLAGLVVAGLAAAGLGAAGLVLAPWTLPSAAAARATSPPGRPALTTASPVSLEIASVSSPSLTPKSQYVLTATIRNGGSRPVTGISVRLRVDWPRLDAEGIARWLDQPADTWAGTMWRTTMAPAPLEPGAATTVRIEADADNLGLPTGTEAFGPRGLAVELVGDTGDGARRLTLLRSVLVWDPGVAGDAAAPGSPPPVRLAVLAPVTPPPRGAGSDAGQVRPQLVAEWSDGGRLRRVLAAAADPAVAWAVDPSLLTAADSAATAVQGDVGTGTATSPAPDGGTPPPSAGGTGDGSPTRPASSPAAQVPPPAGASVTGRPAVTPDEVSPAPPNESADPAEWAALRRANRVAQEWLSLVTDTTGRDMYSLPWGDPDLTAITHGDGAALLNAGQDAAVAATRGPFGQALDYTLAWPVDELADRDTLALLGGTADRTVLLSGAQLPEGIVPGSLALPGQRPDVTALVTDPDLGRAVAGMAGAGSDDPLVAAQRALALLAAHSVAAAEAGVSGDAAGLVAALPRNWDPTRPRQMAKGLELLRSARWIHVEHLGEARSRPPDAQLTTAGGGQADALRFDYPFTARAAELPADHVTTVAGAFQRFRSIYSALADPDPVFFPLRRTALSLVSTSWRAQSSGGESDGDWTAQLEQARAPLLAEVQQFFEGISVATGSDVNLLTRSGALPVTVTSTLPYPIDLVVRLRPLSGRLVAGPPQPVSLAAAGTGTARANALVSVDARANGDVDVLATLAAPDGTALVVADQPIRVRVRHNWEDRGLLVTALVLGMLLLIGLVRSARRSRGTRIPPEAVPDPDDVGRVAPARTGASGTGSAAEAARPSSVLPAAAAAQVRIPVTAGAGAGAPRTGIAVGADASTLAGSADADIKDTPPGTGPLDDQPQSDQPKPDQPRPDQPRPDQPDRAASGSASDPPRSLPASSRATSLLRSSAVMSAGTLVSRILGLVRVVVLSAAIGAMASGDAFNTANTLPNTLFILIGGGALNAVLVPQIVRAAQREDGGADYVDRLLTLAIVVLGGATVVLTAAAPLLIRLYSKDWSEPKIALGTAFALWCLPQIFFYGLYTLYGQVLNARGSFGPYMWAPVVNNVVAIAGMGVFIAMAGAGVRPVEAWSALDIAVLAGTTTLGVVAQALVLVPVLRRSGYTWRPRWGWRGVGMGTAGAVAGWTFAGVAVAQLGFLVISRVVNAAGDAAGVAGGRTVFDVAFLIFMLPHSLITVSVVTALFTPMSAAAAQGRVEEVRDDLSRATRSVGVVTVFATAAFLVLGEDLVRAMFIGTDATTTSQYAVAAAAMLLGLVPYSAQYLVQRVFYAFSDARTPFLVGALGTALWVAGALLAPRLVAARDVAAAVGLALAVSTVITITVWVPLVRRRLGGLDLRRILGLHLRLIVAAAAAAAVGVLLRQLVVGSGAMADGGRVGAAILVVVIGTILATVYLLMLRVLRVTELDALVNPLRARLTGRR